MNATDVAIVGAGPYGLSVAAHLRARGVGHRIFGKPLSSWREHMPKGMYLKSEGFASSIAAPERRFTLAEFCRQTGLPYADFAAPVSIETFRAYGTWFRERAVPDAEPVSVTALDRDGDGFALELDGGERVRARRVVLAVGLAHAAYTPPALREQPPDLVSHTFDHADLSRFEGRDVTVIGRGQSALESATLAREAGADVRVVTRSEVLQWNPAPWTGPRGLRRRVVAPRSGLGDSWPVWFYTHGDPVFMRLPWRSRVRIAREALGPAGAWWLRNRFEPHVPMLLGRQLAAAEPRDGRIGLRLVRPGAADAMIETDHVIAATGYRFDVDRLQFIGPVLRAELRTRLGSPILSPTLESSAPGLHFVGLGAANTAGPVMRFVCGTGVAARRVSRQLAARRP